MTPPTTSQIRLSRCLQAAISAQQHYLWEIEQLKNKLTQNEEKTRKFVQIISEDCKQSLERRDSIIEQQGGKISDHEKIIAQQNQTINQQSQTIHHLQQVIALRDAKHMDQAAIINRQNYEIRDLRDEVLKSRSDLTEEIKELLEKIKMLQDYRNL
ncbi:unnamed protein product [Blepharisma stoltei]|uniref:Uncharacterized protein n=1 Tax=Blepharisma stoltei TaxID=1481888 RepID=A0AAU9KB06_9CILI|nr:unnamed protein product [Blepharisma stoltei]